MNTSMYYAIDASCKNCPQGNIIQRQQMTQYVWNAIQEVIAVCMEYGMDYVVMCGTDVPRKGATSGQVCDYCSAGRYAPERGTPLLASCIQIVHLVVFPKRWQQNALNVKLVHALLVIFVNPANLELMLQ